MKKSVTFFLALVISCITVSGAIHVKGNHHFEAYYSYGVTHPESDMEYHWWFEKDKVSMVTPGWRLTLDKQANRILAVNLEEKTYTEISLAAPQTSHLEQTLPEVLKDYELHGTITPLNPQLNGEETVNGKTCRSFASTEWLIFQKGRFYDRERTLEITRDVPFDWKLLEELYQWIRAPFNPQESYLQALKTIPGFIWSSQDVHFASGNKIRWSFNVVDLTTTDAPAGTFAIPEGFTKKESLTRPDIIAIRGLLYIYP